MYRSKADNENKKPSNLSDREEQILELSLEKAVKILKQQSLSYQHAGLTHISSLLD